MNMEMAVFKILIFFGFCLALCRSNSMMNLTYLFDNKISIQQQYPWLRSYGTNLTEDCPICDPAIPGDCKTIYQVGFCYPVIKYKLKLTVAPTADVTFDLTWDTNLMQQTEGTSRLTFTSSNYNTRQTVELRATSNYAADGTRYGFLKQVVNSSDTRFQNITLYDVVTIYDDEVPGVTASNITNTDLFEGNSSHGVLFNVQLNSKPYGPLEVTFAQGQNPLLNYTKGQSFISFQPQFMEFNTNNWNTTQVLTVSSVDNNENFGLHSVPFLFDVGRGSPASSLDWKYVPNVTGNLGSVTFHDNDIPGININASSIKWREGLISTPYSLSLKTKPKDSTNVTIFINSTCGSRVDTNFNYSTALVFDNQTWNKNQEVSRVIIQEEVYKQPLKCRHVHTIVSEDPSYLLFTSSANESSTIDAIRKIGTVNASSWVSLPFVNASNVSLRGNGTVAFIIGDDDSPMISRQVGDIIVVAVTLCAAVSFILMISPLFIGESLIEDFLVLSRFAQFWIMTSYLGIFRANTNVLGYITYQVSWLNMVFSRPTPIAYYQPTYLTNYWAHAVHYHVMWNAFVIGMIGFTLMIILHELYSRTNIWLIHRDQHRIYRKLSSIRGKRRMSRAITKISQERGSMFKSRQRRDTFAEALAVAASKAKINMENFPTSLRSIRNEQSSQNSEQQVEGKSTEPKDKMIEMSKMSLKEDKEPQRKHLLNAKRYSMARAESAMHGERIIDTHKQKTTKERIEIFLAKHHLFRWLIIVWSFCFPGFSLIGFLATRDASRRSKGDISILLEGFWGMLLVCATSIPILYFYLARVRVALRDDLISFKDVDIDYEDDDKIRTGRDLEHHEKKVHLVHGAQFRSFTRLGKLGYWYEPRTILAKRFQAKFGSLYDEYKPENNSYLYGLLTMFKMFITAAVVTTFDYSPVWQTIFVLFLLLGNLALCIYYMPFLRGARNVLEILIISVQIVTVSCALPLYGASSQWFVDNPSIIGYRIEYSIIMLNLMTILIIFGYCISLNIEFVRRAIKLFERRLHFRNKFEDTDFTGGSSKKQFMSPSGAALGTDQKNDAKILNQVKKDLPKEFPVDKFLQPPKI